MPKPSKIILSSKYSESIDPPRANLKSTERDKKMKWKKQDDRLPEPIKNSRPEIDSNCDYEERIDDDMSWYEDLLYDQWREQQIQKGLPQR